MILNAANGAVSVRSTLGPSEIASNPISFAIVISFFEKPPSGPEAIEISFLTEPIDLRVLLHPGVSIIFFPDEFEVTASEKL